jgi:hypothetical protein
VLFYAQGSPPTNFKLSRSGCSPSRHEGNANRRKYRFLCNERGIPLVEVFRFQWAQVAQRSRAAG